MACNPGNVPLRGSSVNSRYNDEQPDLSGNGRYLAWVSNRNGTSEILLYDIERRRFVELPGLNRPGIPVQSPSLSQTGRYIVYLTSEKGRLAIALYDRAVGKSQILTQQYRGWIRNPSISPEGRYIVFETARRGQWDVEVFDRGPNVEPDLAEGTPVPNP